MNTNEATEMDAAEYEGTLEECRAWLARKLGREDVPDAVWGHVVKIGLPYYFITHGDEESRRELADEARAYLRDSIDEPLGHSRPPDRGSQRGGPAEVELGLSPYVLKRGQVFSEVAAAIANTDPAVLAFRERYLGGQVLTVDEAATFLEALEIDCKSLKAEALETRDELYSLAERLAQTHRWREGDGEGDATWFVLIGNVPEVRPVVVAVGRYWSTKNPNWAQITLKVEPWVDVKEVARLYKEVQRQVLGKAENKKKGDQVLEAVRFVAQQIRDHGDETWHRRTERWNHAYPEHRYKSFRGLRQAFERFVHPMYHRAKWKTYRPSPYQEWRDKRRRTEAERRQQSK